MNRMMRPVDHAMCEDRAEKIAVRKLWIEEVKATSTNYFLEDIPLYLTLPGAEGKDIELLIEEGIIGITEVNSIKEEDQNKVVAVESNNQAIISLQKKFIGLKIKQEHFQNLIKGDKIFTWPKGDDERYCRAKIINLDLNAPLIALADQNPVKFAVLSWIDKLCYIHAKPPCLDWTLFLTLHGEIGWPENVNTYTLKFLLDNINREPQFGESCKDFWGKEMYEVIETGKTVNFFQMSRIDQQKLIMVIVPKLITQLVHSTGWVVETERNLRYGGTENSAPMVTWILKFRWDENAAATPDANYRHALIDIFQGTGFISKEGTISN